MKLYPYQEETCKEALQVFLSGKPFSLLRGDVGVGKTVMALEVARRLGSKYVGVIAPKITLTSWTKTAKAMGVHLGFCLNPEMLRTGRVKNIVTLNPLDKRVYEYRLPERDTLIIVDEIHRFGGMDTQSAYLLFGTKATEARVLGLTGTLGESPLRLRAILSLCNLVPWKDFPRWAVEHGCFRNHDITGSPWQFVKGRRAMEIMTQIGRDLFPAHGTQLSVDDIPGYPECDVQARLYDMPDRLLSEVNKIYRALRDEIQKPEHAPNSLVEQLRHRQQVQAIKVPLFVELTKELLDEGKSVVSFFDFREPLEMYEQEIKKLGYQVSSIHGDTPTKERNRIMAEQARDNIQVIGAITAAGGIGINLGDVRGERPRVGLLNIPIDGITAHQACGRIHRATNKTKALNIFVLLAGSPIEERIYSLLSGKLRNLASIQGDDIRKTILMKGDL